MASRLRAKLTAIAHHPRPLRYLWSMLLWHTRLSHWFTVDCGGYRLRYFRTSMSAGHFVDPDCRAEDDEFLRAWLRPGDRVIDVGANVGTLSLRAAGMVGPDGHVLAIEAHPRIAACLTANVALNGFGQVEVRQTALGDAPGEVRFSDDYSDDQNRVDSAAGGCLVPIARLDDLLTDDERIDLLKIDVEGYELPVLRGAERALARCRCVYFEAADEAYQRYGYTLADIQRLLTEEGFTLYRRAGGRLIPVRLGGGAPELENLIAWREPAEALERTGWLTGEM